MIGIFDSGMGGLTVLADAMKMLPNESFVYYGDFKNAPYGIKTKQEVLKLSEHICEILINKYHVKAIVIACNTATSAAVTNLRRKYTIPIIGMEPAVKPAIVLNNGKKIAVMATEMTLKERKFNQLINRFENKNRIIKVPCSSLVKQIETIDFDQESLDQILNKCIPTIDSIESIVLGCTHFIFIKEYLNDKYEGQIKIFDGNIGTIKNLTNRLIKNNLLDRTDEKQEILIIGSGSQEKIELSKKVFNRYCKGRLI
jgi:glutamate racemase